MQMSMSMWMCWPNVLALALLACPFSMKKLLSAGTDVKLISRLSSLLPYFLPSSSPILPPR